MMRLHDFLDYQSRDYGDLDFAIFGEQSMNYTEACSLSHRIGNALVRLCMQQSAD